MIGSFYVRLPFSYKKLQKGTENYDESNGKKTGSTKKPGENFKDLLIKVKSQNKKIR